MSSIREFSLPYKQRTRPESVPQPVWDAFADWADFRGSHEESQIKWDIYQEARKPWIDPETTQWRDKPVYPEPKQLNLFAS
jgi:hypothetical protein